MQDADLFTKHPPDNKQRLDQQGHIGRFATSSLMRASNLTVPTMPTLRPKLRKVARRSFSMAMASTEVACDGSGAFEASDCVTSSRAPDDKAPPASSVLCRAHHCGPSC